MVRSPLIDARSLAQHSDDPRWVVVDCRFNLLDPPAGRAVYGAGHVPGARYADLDRDLAKPPLPSEGRHPLPAPHDLATTLGEWGISEDDTVVVYDEGSSAIAARLWWLLGWIGHDRAFVLDGGFGAWQRAGLPLETTAPSWQPKRYSQPRVAADTVVATAELPEYLRRGALLVDARAAPRYRGETEPIDPVAGHVPGAVNWPFSNNVTSTGEFRAADELRHDLTALLAGRPSSEFIAMCGSGVTACHTLLAMAVAGLPAGRLYAGSWSEWIRDPARPIATGPNP